MRGRAGRHCAHSPVTHRMEGEAVGGGGGNGARTHRMEFQVSVDRAYVWAGRGDDDRVRSLSSKAASELERTGAWNRSGRRKLESSTPLLVFCGGDFQRASDGIRSSFL